MPKKKLAQMAIVKHQSNQKQIRSKYVQILKQRYKSEYSRLGQIGMVSLNADIWSSNRIIGMSANPITKNEIL